MLENLLGFLLSGGTSKYEPEITAVKMAVQLLATGKVLFEFDGCYFFVAAQLTDEDVTKIFNVHDLLQVFMLSFLEAVNGAVCGGVLGEYSVPFSDNLALQAVSKKVL